MSDERRQGIRGMDDEMWGDDPLERELRELGPLMLRQERLEAEAPDPLFAHGLRARLVGAGDASPSTDFRRRLRDRLAGNGVYPALAVRARRPRRHPALRLGLAVAVVAALLAGAASGAPQHAWAELRQWLASVVPGLGVGQVPSTALVATAPITAGDSALRLTVTSVVVEPHATLVSYTANGSALGAPYGAAPVADALAATLGDGRGHSGPSLGWLPVWRDFTRGVPTIRGLLIFDALPPKTRTAYLWVNQLPDTPPLRPLTLKLSLRPIGPGDAQPSVAVNHADMHSGVTLTVSDLTRLRDATVADMSTAITGGPYRGGTVISLTPEQAVGPFAPTLTGGGGAALAPERPLLPATVRPRVLSRPEFVFPPAPRGRALSLVVPSIAVQGQDQAALIVQAVAHIGRYTASLGRATFAVTGMARTPPAALGLGDTRQLRLTISFPPAGARASLRSVDVIDDGVAQTVSRDDPTVDVPLAPGQRTVRLTVAHPVVVVNGPWRITIAG